MSGYEPSSVEVSSLYISFLSSVQFHAWNDKLVVGAQPFYSCCKLILAHHRLTWAVIVRATATVTVRAFRWCSARGTHVVNGDCVPFGTLGEQSRFLNGRLRVTSYQSPSWQGKGLLAGEAFALGYGRNISRRFGPLSSLSPSRRSRKTLPTL